MAVKGDVLLAVKAHIHNDSKNLDLIPWDYHLALDGEEFRIYSACVPREMHDRHLLHFNCYAAASLPVESFVNYRLYPSPVALGHWSRYPSNVGPYERYGSTIPVDLGLHQICIEEQRRHRDKGDPCGSPYYGNSLLSEL